MSLYPFYKSFVQGTADWDDYDYIDRRYLRSSSALPDYTYLRGYDRHKSPIVERALSTARELITAPSLYSDYYYDSSDTLSRLNDTLRRSEARYANMLRRREYLSSPSHRTYSSSYWSYYPYSSALVSPYLNYGNSWWSVNDPISDYYPYGRYGSPLSRLTWRDWAINRPYTSYSQYYTPRYILPSGVRSTYLYPKYYF